MPVTATEISIRLRRPPHDVFSLEPLPSATRYGSGSGRKPVAVPGRKKPGARLDTSAAGAHLHRAPGSDIRSYDRLIAAALSGDRWLFARQDTVEALARRRPGTRDVVPFHSYARGSWGPSRPTASCRTTCRGIPGPERGQERERGGSPIADETRRQRLVIVAAASGLVRHPPAVRRPSRHLIRPHCSARIRALLHHSRHRHLSDGQDHRAIAPDTLEAQQP